MFMATAPPLDDPTTTWGWCLSNSAWAMRTASSKVSSGSFGIDDRVAVVFQVGRLHAAWNRLPAVEEEDGHGVSEFFSLRQFWQYQGAGNFTGFGLRLRHLPQRNRLPFTAVFGRAFFPLLKMFFAIGTFILHGFLRSFFHARPIASAAMIASATMSGGTSTAR